MSRIPLVYGNLVNQIKIAKRKIMKDYCTYETYSLSEPSKSISLLLHPLQIHEC